MGTGPIFSVRDDSDNGTVVDFLQRRWQMSLGTVRKELRGWLRVDRPRVPIELYRPSVQLQERDEAAAAAAYSSARPTRCHYLEDRGISREVAADRRFVGAYRLGERGNVLFPLRDPATGLVVGFEVKNKGFTSFASGGRKTFWMSDARDDDDRLVVVESSIDAFSYHQLFPHQHARYLSTAGAVGPEALALVGAAIASMPAGAEIVSATDADEGGEKLHRQIEVAAGRPLRRHASPLPKDWNDYLRKMLEWVSKRMRIAKAPGFVYEFVEREAIGDLEAIYELAKYSDDNPEEAQRVITDYKPGGHLREQLKAAQRPLGDD
jgi:hypothetical protein